MLYGTLILLVAALILLLTDRLIMHATDLGRQLLSACRSTSLLQNARWQSLISLHFCLSLCCKFSGWGKSTLCLCAVILNNLNPFSVDTPLFCLHRQIYKREKMYGQWMISLKIKPLFQKTGQRAWLYTFLGKLLVHPVCDFLPFCREEFIKYVYL